MPVVMHKVPRERTLLGRTQPEIIVQGVWNWFSGLVTNISSPSVNNSPCHVYLSNDALAQMLHGFLQGFRASPLNDMLTETIVFGGCFNHPPPYPNVVCSPFLDVDIFTCLTSPDSIQGMPVVGSRNRDHIDLFVVEDLPQILNCLDFPPILCFKL